MIEFPKWVTGPTPCKTRTFSIVLPGGGFKGGRHGAIRIEKAFVNRPMVKLPRRGLPGFYMGWADMK